MSNNNKLEITITTTSNVLEDKKLKEFFMRNKICNIKKIKVLKDRKKAFITFSDIKSFKRAINLIPAPRDIKIIPTNINNTMIYERQQTINEKLDYLVHLVNDLGNYIENTFEHLELSTLLSISDRLGINVSDIVHETDFEKCDDPDSSFETDQKYSKIDEEPRTELKLTKYLNERKANNIREIAVEMDTEKADDRDSSFENDQKFSSPLRETYTKRRKSF